MVGTKDGDPTSTCSQYEMLYNAKSPPWTADGSQAELKKHVLCCAQEEAMTHETDISRGMNPIWLDDSHGWSGGSYSDAEEFCAGIGGKRLCPYAACEFIWMLCQKFLVLVKSFLFLKVNSSPYVCKYYPQTVHMDRDRTPWEDTRSTSTVRENSGRLSMVAKTIGCWWEGNTATLPPPATHTESWKEGHRRGD